MLCITVCKLPLGWSEAEIAPSPAPAGAVCSASHAAALRPAGPEHCLLSIRAARPGTQQPLAAGHQQP